VRCGDDQILLRNFDDCSFSDWRGQQPQEEGHKVQQAKEKKWAMEGNWHDGESSSARGLSIIENKKFSSESSDRLIGHGVVFFRRLLML
jgi:hypothetical protein